RPPRGAAADRQPAARGEWRAVGGRQRGLQSGAGGARFHRAAAERAGEALTRALFSLSRAMLLPSPACGRGVGGEGALASARSPATKQFRAPAAPELLFSCVAKRKVTKREGHPGWRVPSIHGRKVGEVGPGFSSGLLSARKGEAIHGLARCAA